MRASVLAALVLTVSGMVFVARPAQAAVVTFDALVTGQTSFGFDGDGDSINDVIFTTTDPSGFNTIGPGANQSFIDEPGLEGTSLLDPDLRVNFLNGASGSLSFGFALNSGIVDPAFFASMNVFDANGNLIGSDTEVGAFTTTPQGRSGFPEGVVMVAFPGVASFATFNFTSQGGRYIIDNFEGTFGSTETVIPEPSSIVMVGLGAVGLVCVRRRFR